MCTEGWGVVASPGQRDRSEARGATGGEAGRGEGAKTHARGHGSPTEEVSSSVESADAAPTGRGAVGGSGGGSSVAQRGRCARSTVSQTWSRHTLVNSHPAQAAPSQESWAHLWQPAERLDALQVHGPALWVRVATILVEDRHEGPQLEASQAADDAPRAMLHARGVSGVSRRCENGEATEQGRTFPLLQ